MCHSKQVQRLSENNPHITRTYSNLCAPPSDQSPGHRGARNRRRGSLGLRRRSRSRRTRRGPSGPTTLGPDDHPPSGATYDTRPRVSGCLGGAPVEYCGEEGRVGAECGALVEGVIGGSESGNKGPFGLEGFCVPTSLGSCVSRHTTNVFTHLFWSASTLLSSPVQVGGPGPDPVCLSVIEADDAPMHQSSRQRTLVWVTGQRSTLKLHWSNRRGPTPPSPPNDGRYRSPGDSVVLLNPTLRKYGDGREEWTGVPAGPGTSTLLS